MTHNPDQNHPTPSAEHPDAAHTYERAKPRRESLTGQLHAPAAPQHAQPDKAGPESTSRHTNRPDSDSAENDVESTPRQVPSSHE